VDRAIIDATARALEAHAHAIVAGYLFGSVARGTNRSRSDIDLALLLKQTPESGTSKLGIELAFELELELKRAVDLVILNTASPDLIHRVLRDGILLLETDRRARSEFEVRARAQYLDLAPLRRLYRHEYAAKGTPGAARGRRGST
jgi:predicted nucleotidyltransferase